jgi:hypothetical protein
MCRICGKTIPYAGKGRPKEYCQECKKIQKEKRRIQQAKYMRKYREKIISMFYDDKYHGVRE